MLRSLLLVVICYGGLASAGGDGPLITKIKQKLSTAMPSGCRECMAQCPHDGHTMMECDRGCPESCSRDQAASYNQQVAGNAAYGDCYSCMRECPHSTKEPKACDSGCAAVCDAKGMRAAFVKANGIAKSCAPIPGVDDNVRGGNGGGGNDGSSRGGGESSSSR